MEELFLLRRARQRANQAFNEVMTSFDVTPLQFSVLMVLRSRPDCHQSELAKLTSMQAATAVGVVRLLKQKGLIHQERDTRHLRRNRITLTSKGLLLASKLHDAYQDVERAVLAKLTVHEARQFKRLLQKLTCAE